MKYGNKNSDYSDSENRVEKLFRLGSKQTRRTLETLYTHKLRLVRNLSPVRGFFNKGFKVQNKSIDVNEATQKKIEQETGGAINRVGSPLLDFLHAAFKQHKSKLESDTSLTEKQKASILAFEQFQAKTKGPMAPVTEELYYEKILEPAFNFETHHIQESDGLAFEQSAEKVLNYYDKGLQVNLDEIDFEEEGKALPNQTMRGFPYNGKGYLWDDEIIASAGKSIVDILKYTRTLDFNPSFPGYRIQGKMGPGPAKLRLVNMPSIYYQYLLLGIVRQLMRKLKESPAFVGGLKPDDRESRIRRDIDEAYKNGYYLLAIDFSSFDHSCSFNFRGKFGEYIFNKINHPNKEELMDVYKTLQKNQFMVLEDKNSNRPQLYPFDILLSGAVDTQLTGSFINLFLQQYAADKLGIPFENRGSYALGDDVAFPIPIEFVNYHGYQKVLEMLNDIGKPLGFSTNPSKAYPNTDLVFLQKLYSGESKVYSQGSLARNLWSFVYQEKFHKSLPGINSLQALDIIAQLSILQNAYNAYDRHNLNENVDEFVQLGYDHDDTLAFIVNHVIDTYSANRGHMIFQSLIDGTKVRNEDILQHLDIMSYDHTGLAETLLDGKVSDYSKVFFALDYLGNKVIRRKVDSSALNESLKLSFKHSKDDEILLEDD